MTQLTIIYLTLTVAVAATCWLAYRVDEAASDLYTAALVVLLFASLTAVIHMWVPPPWGSAGNPLQDVICVFLFTGAYTSGRRRWAAALAVLFTVQLFIHAGYWTTGDFSNHARRLYAIKVNTLFCGELATLFLTGGGHVVRNRRHLAGLLRRRAVAAHPYAGQ